MHRKVEFYGYNWADFGKALIDSLGCRESVRSMKQLFNDVSSLPELAVAISTDSIERHNPANNALPTKELGHMAHGGLKEGQVLQCAKQDQLPDRPDQPLTDVEASKQVPRAAKHEGDHQKCVHNTTDPKDSSSMFLEYSLNADGSLNPEVADGSEHQKDEDLLGSEAIALGKATSPVIEVAEKEGRDCSTLYHNKCRSGNAQRPTSSSSPMANPHMSNVTAPTQLDGCQPPMSDPHQRQEAPKGPQSPGPEDAEQEQNGGFSPPMQEESGAQPQASTVAIAVQAVPHRHAQFMERNALQKVVPAQTANHPEQPEELRAPHDKSFEASSKSGDYGPDPVQIDSSKDQGGKTFQAWRKNQANGFCQGDCQVNLETSSLRADALLEPTVSSLGVWQSAADSMQDAQHAPRSSSDTAEARNNEAKAVSLSRATKTDQEAAEESVEGKADAHCSPRKEFPIPVSTKPLVSAGNIEVKARSPTCNAQPAAKDHQLPREPVANVTGKRPTLDQCPDIGQATKAIIDVPLPRGGSCSADSTVHEIQACRKAADGTAQETQNHDDHQNASRIVSESHTFPRGGPPEVGTVIPIPVQQRKRRAVAWPLTISGLQNGIPSCFVRGTAFMSAQVTII